MERQRFESMYEGQAPWDIDGPQPLFVRLADQGKIRGAVLDAGCGTGENAMFLAQRGHETWGIDFVPVAIERAKEKCRKRNLQVHFSVANALELGKLGRQFDTIIDCGLFHTFSDQERTIFVDQLEKVLRPGGMYFMACFSDEEPGTEGPRRVSQKEIRDAFREGWEVREIQPTRFAIVDAPGMPAFSPGGPKAWVATIARTSD
jgi:2-polyprenyl-3-methyl-5-hydroxy-6-metoxy-1,4-benzoquinol methylase